MIGLMCESVLVWHGRMYAYGNKRTLAVGKVCVEGYE